MVSAVRRGVSLREVARRFDVNVGTVQRWVKRAYGQRLDRADFSDRSHRAHRVANRTPADMESRLIETRRRLRSESPLGEYGALAVQTDLLARGVSGVPSVRPIGRVFERHGLLDVRHRPRRKAPPKGWYLPQVASGCCELDAFDVVEGLKLADGPLLEVFNGISLHGGLVGSWPQQASVKATDVVVYLKAHWAIHGLPGFAQFDNDTLFQGAHQHRDVVGRVMRLCLSLGVVPVYAPVSEHGFQAAIEAYNGLWQAKVWQRWHHPTINALQERSAAYVSAHHQRTAKRREGAPARRALPQDWALDLQRHPASYPKARLVFIRRTDHDGNVRLMGRLFSVASSWSSRLVRCDLWLGDELIRFHRLRRREPEDQQVLKEVKYVLPKRTFDQ